MFFILLTFATALFIEALGSAVSVIGISSLFGFNAIIISLAIALDVGKIVTVSLLYSHWQNLSKIMKAYALIAAAVTMTITSAGAAGYLSGSFQKAIMGAKEGELKVGVLKEQQQKYQVRKQQIDDQIANLPAKTTVNQRLRLMNGFKQEQKALDEKIAQIDKDLPNLQIAQIGTESKAGPILYIAKAFNISVEEAVKWVILMIIFVFDPLAIFLIIAGNFLVAQRAAAKRELALAEMLERFDPEQHNGRPQIAESDLVKSEDTPFDNNEGAREPEVEQHIEMVRDNERIMEELYQAAQEIEPIVKVEPAVEPPEEVEPAQESTPILTSAPILSTFTIQNSEPLSFGNEPKPIPLGPEIVKKVPVPRSKLGDISADNDTIVDASHLPGFTPAKSAVIKKAGER